MSHAARTSHKPSVKKSYKSESHINRVDLLDINTKRLPKLTESRNRSIYFSYGQCELIGHSWQGMKFILNDILICYSGN